MYSKSLSPVLGTLVVLAGFGGTALAQSRNYHIEIHNPAKFDTGEALKQTPGTEVSTDHRPILNLPSSSTSNNRPDGALQSAPGPLVNTTGGPGFEGVPASGYAPPDTNMAVGPNHIVQWVNIRFAIYDKSGNILAGYPKAGNAFWQGFGGPCETRNDGDPIIQYDAIADRWIAAQFVSAGPPYYQCFAISQTGDPSGAYNRYSYAFTDAFPDYPKVSVWPSAYFASYNMFASTSGGWVGPRICAYDRAAMLSGANALQECFNPGSAYGSLVPSDLDGGRAFAPPSPTGYFLDYGNNSLLLWRFTPNFVTPANASLSGPISMAAASFAPACGGGTCIPQSGGSNLDSLADRLMYRLAYRNFGDHEAMVVNHSVTAGTSVGVRWYEIRNPLTSPVIYQQSTFAPDTAYRWMGSAAMDKAGNMAVGYTASSSTTVPSIRYSGRETTDPLNTLQTEQVIYTSGGPQSGLSRWGDYSAMRIDPSDDCTFWYTSEYIPSAGSFNWRTRVAAFKFNSCGSGATPDFSIGATPASSTVNATGTTGYTVSTTALNAFSGTVTFSISGLPVNASGSFAPPSVTAGGSSTLTISTTGAAAGTYPLTITGTSGALVHSANVNLVVTAPDFTISGTPVSQSVVQGSGVAYSATVAAVNGFSGSVALSISGLPSGATASFSPTSVAGAGTSTLTVNTLSSTPTGTYSLTITGTSGTLLHATNVTLIVAALDFTISASPSSQTVVQGNGTSYTATVAAVNGFAQTVTFSAAGLPSGASASFSPLSVAGAGSSALTVSTTAATPAGTYTLTITGTSASRTHATTVQLVVQAVNPPSFTLVATPTSRTVPAGSTTTYAISVVPSNGFNANVAFSVTGLPAKTSATFTPTSSTSGTTLSVKPNPAAKPGTSTLTITGVGGGVSSTVQVTLIVQ
jgi:hypothetical protein